jgi:hypothetical protein
MFRVLLTIVALLLILAGALPPPPSEAQEKRSPTLDRLSESVVRLERSVGIDRDAATAPEVADQTFRDPSWTKAVYEVRVIGDGGVTAGGTAVAVRRDALHTAKHLGEGLSRPRYEVRIDSAWRPAIPSPVSRKDLAVLTVPGVTLDYVPVRVPVYGERVSVYGLKTKSFSQGMYIGDHNPEIGSGRVALDADAVPTEQGDSGGGIFGDDGTLLGTISGRMSHEHLVASMVPIVSDASVAADKAVAARTQPSARAPCVGGFCPLSR